jgi:hypothetical protein
MLKFDKFVCLPFGPQRPSSGRRPWRGDPKFTRMTVPDWLLNSDPAIPLAGVARSLPCID